MPSHHEPTGPVPGPSRLDDALLRAWLHEDAPHGDLSTEALALAGRPARVRFEARTAATLSGVEEAARLFGLAGARAWPLAASGSRTVPGQAVLEGEGPAVAVLKAWKVAQTLMEFMGGIASATAAIVDTLRAEGLEQPLACTRKCAPGTRAASARAVRDGGGVMHRLGLSETLLVFPEHRALLDPADWPAALGRLARQQPEKRVVVEVGSADDALQAARAGAEVLQLERFTPEALAALRLRLQSAGLSVRLAPAGGVTLANALAYARAGADLLVSSAPYFAPPTDIRVTIGPA